MVRRFLLLFLLLAAPAWAGQPPPVNSYSGAAVSTMTTAGDTYCIQGSDTKVVQITAVNISGIANGSSNEEVGLFRRSAPDTGGTSASVPVIPYDTTSPPATATVTLYSVAPTEGAAVGPVRYDLILLGNNNANQAFQTRQFRWQPERALILRSSGEFLCLKFVTAPGTGAAIAISHEHTEY